jgi:hypothetical protein
MLQLPRRPNRNSIINAAPGEPEQKLNHLHCFVFLRETSCIFVDQALTKSEHTIH